jgi:hypothetical protein
MPSREFYFIFPRFLIYAVQQQQQAYVMHFVHSKSRCMYGQQEALDLVVLHFGIPRQRVIKGMICTFGVCQSV